MAIYCYTCPIHGDFELTRPMADSDELGACPECGRAVERDRFTKQNIAFDYKGLWMGNNGGYSIGDDRLK